MTHRQYCLGTKMAVITYKAWGWGHPVGIGVTGAIHVGIAGIAKKATAHDTYTIVNEMVCSHLARALFLPCPPGALIEKSSEKYFFSLDFNMSGMALPPADAAAIVAAHPRLAWGIIAFDCLVMNKDRHSQNIAHDTMTNQVQIFDHSHAFLGPGNGDISTILAGRDGNLCIDCHCLAKEINDHDGRELWSQRIASLPDFFIEELVQATTEVGLPSDKKEDCVAFLKKRKIEVGSILSSNVASFPKLP